MKQGHFNVAPRYSPGSPALVDEGIARKVAEDEKRFIEHALEGVWGEAQKARAEKLGLRGIVEYRVEKGSGKKLGWQVEDLCTGEKFFRLCSESLQKLGYKRFNELDWWAKQALKDLDESDQKNGWFMVGSTVTQYQPEKLPS
jgi:hypothetical protein